jgi:hypothetical protein
MRIVIEIDGEQVTAMVHDRGVAEDAPPAELLKAAAALGAASAGPAPAEAARPGLISLAPELREALRQPPLEAGEAPEEAKPSRAQRPSRGKRRKAR